MLLNVYLVEGSLEAKRYGQMEKHIEEEARTGRKSEVRRSEVEKMRKGESQKREGAGARKGRKVAKHSGFSNVFWLQRVEK